MMAVFPAFIQLRNAEADLTAAHAIQTLQDLAEIRPECGDYRRRLHSLER